MKTDKIEITTLDGWWPVSDDPKDILVQLRSSDLLEVYATEGFAPGPADSGVILFSGGNMEFSAAGMSAGTSFYVRLIRENETATVVIMHNGTTPAYGGGGGEVLPGGGGGGGEPIGDSG